jgi:hypothetical protein
LVEFAIILPSFLLVMVGTIDFGFAFYANMTLEYASREGARVGSALASGNSTSAPCGDVDGHIIAAAQRVLESAGIAVRLDPSDPAKSGVLWVRIYKADTSGNGWTSNYNEWTYSAGNGPVVDGTKLDFVQGTVGWNACPLGNRKNGATPDSLGVAISYRHALVIPTGPFLGGSINLLDKTVMVLNPTYP